MHAPIPPSPKPKGTDKFSDARIANIIAGLALVVTLGTLGFSVYNYQETQSAERSAGLAQQATEVARYADRVSYWFSGSGDNEQVQISNLNDQTITNVEVMAESLSAEPSLPIGTVGFAELDNIPPCSIMAADALNAARIFMVQNPAGPPPVPVPPQLLPLTPAAVPSGSSLPSLPSGFVATPIPFVPGPTTAPISISQAERQVLVFERRNGFKVKLDLLIFTDVNGTRWGRDDQDKLVDSSNPILTNVISQYDFTPAINATSQIRSANTGCS